MTETLPYEVPVIFSNDRLFVSLCGGALSAGATAIVSKLRGLHYRFTVPYGYKIAKDRTRDTALSIVHPNHQMRIAEFYETYKNALLYHCNVSQISLRHPTEEMPYYTEEEMEPGKTEKLGIPHIEPEDGEVDVSHITSYFTYGRFNLFGKFFDSQEALDLEKKFKFVRTIDITKCFSNIYTHSLTWAVKGKPFAKEHSATVFSFESEFDSLMQHANYNETNGIVIGPEISRIFAEIIFQTVDIDVTRNIKNLEYGRDYDMRRYVDDYLIYGSSSEALDIVQAEIENRLEAYKLFVNTDKTKTMRRPFVSQLTLARSELKEAIQAMQECVSVAKDAPARLRSQALSLSRKTDDIRLICKRYEVEVSSVSGWVLASLRAVLKRIVSAVGGTADVEEMRGWANMSVAVLRSAFYILALDTRVRTTYNICQIVELVEKLNKPDNADMYDRLAYIIVQEIKALVGRTAIGDDGRNVVEVSNLLITGAHYLGSDFIKSEQVKTKLRDICSKREVTYFEYITAKFCMLKDETFYATQLQELNANVRQRLIEQSDMVAVHAEVFLLLCDYLSAPDVTPAERRSIVERVLGGQPSNADSTRAGEVLSFVDWGGLHIAHTLARKELRPVYAIS